MTLTEARRKLRAKMMMAVRTHDDVIHVREASAVIVAAGFCPTCTCEPESQNVKLLPWEAGDKFNMAGRECPKCEDFHCCGPQPENDMSPDTFSDADSGL